MRFSSSPKSNSENYYDQGKFNLTWYTYIIFSILSLILTIIHLFSKSDNLYFTSVGLLLSVLNLIILYFTKRYYLVGIITLLSTTVVTQLMIFTQLNPDRTVDIIWIFSLSILSFYILNYKWGIFTLVSNFVGLIFWQVYLGDKIKIRLIEDLSVGDQIDYYLNILFGLIIISYLMVRFIKENTHSTKLYIDSNKKLSSQNTIINQQNDEKTVMLKEIHHRVKNNLQIVTSLLRLQSRELEDKKTIEQFEEATNRIVAMALIHDKMYQSKDLAKIDFKDYIESLTNDLIKTYSIQIPIHTSIKSTIELISPKFLVSIALLFNELITNSLKHGFKNQISGEIKIDINISSNNIILTYYDNGTWLNSTKESSFGIELIETLSEQLDGTFERNTESGTLYTFAFPYTKDNI